LEKNERKRKSISKVVSSFLYPCQILKSRRKKLDIGVCRGEGGSGKIRIPEASHTRSDRKNMSFIRVNCATLTPDPLVSELFGHVRGAFTGATETRAGLIAAADRGTVFLDEIGILSYTGQACSAFSRRERSCRSSPLAPAP
jgi:transcriptional regulator with PAS, ATPase and Fis domain